jgi:hypothetical protein
MITPILTFSFQHVNCDLTYLYYPWRPLSCDHITPEHIPFNILMHNIQIQVYLCRGGLTITVVGENLDSIAEPVLFIDMERRQYNSEYNTYDKVDVMRFYSVCFVCYICVHVWIITVRFLVIFLIVPMINQLTSWDQSLFNKMTKLL